jgi:hypothetical protein
MLLIKSEERASRYFKAHNKRIDGNFVFFSRPYLRFAQNMSEWADVSVLIEHGEMMF